MEITLITYTTGEYEDMYTTTIRAHRDTVDALLWVERANEILAAHGLGYCPRDQRPHYSERDDLIERVRAELNLDDLDVDYTGGEFGTTTTTLED